MGYHVLERELLMPMLKKVGINTPRELAERSQLDLSTIRRSFTGTPSAQLLVYLSAGLRIDLRKVLVEKQPKRRSPLIRAAPCGICRHDECVEKGVHRQVKGLAGAVTPAKPVMTKPTSMQRLANLTKESYAGQR